MGTFLKGNTGLPNQESAGYWRRVFSLGLNGKKKRNRIKPANQIHFPLCSSCCFESVSQRSGSPGITITLIFTNHTCMCFMIKDLKAAPFKSFQVLMGFMELSKIAKFFMGIQVNIYTKAALPGRRQAQIHNQANCVPTKPDTSPHGPYIFKSSTRENGAIKR